MNDSQQLENAILSFLHQQSQEAHRYLLSIYKNPESILLFFQCFQATQNESVKMFCITLMRRMLFNIRDHNQDLPIESQQNIYNVITSLIPNELNDNIRNNMGEFITILKLAPNESSTLECNSFAFNLIQTGQNSLIATAFHILIYGYSNHPDDQKAQLLISVAPIAIQHLMNPDFNCRCKALELLTFLLFDDGNFEILNTNEELCETLSKSVIYNTNRVNTEAVDPNEATEIFDLANICIKSCRIFGEYINQFTEIFVNFLFNDNVDRDIRYSAEESLCNLFQISVDLIEPLLPQIIDGCIKLTIEMSEGFQESENNIDNLISWLQDSLGHERVYLIFSKKAFELINLNNIAAISVALDIFENIIFTSEDLDIDESEFDKIINLIFNYLEPKNNTDSEGNISALIPSRCAKLVISLIEFDEDEMSVQAETLIPLLFNYIFDHYCASAIEELTKKGDISQENQMLYLQQTMKLIDSSISNPKSNINVSPDTLISLLRDFLLVNSIDETLFPKIIPLVQLLINSPDFSPSQKMLAIGCFGDLIPICPKSASPMIDEFIKLSLSLFSEDDPETNTNIIEFLDTVLNNQSKFLAPYINQIFETLGRIINLGENGLCIKRNEDEEKLEDLFIDEEEKDNRDAALIQSNYCMQKEALRMLVEICSIYPQQTANFLDQIFTLLKKYTKSPDYYLACSAIQDFDQLSTAYLAVNADADPLLNYLIDQLKSPSSGPYDLVNYWKEFIAEYWKEIAVVMANAGKQLIIRRASEITSILRDVFIDKKNIYNKKGDANDIDKTFRAPIFTTFDLFVEELGPDCHQFIGPFIEVLVNIANNRSKNTHCYAAQTLAKIASTLPPEDANGNQFVSLALQTALNDIKKKDTKTCGISTLNIILNYRPDLIDPIKSDLIQFCMSVVQRSKAGAAENDDFLNGCIVLYLTIVRLFNIVDENSINVINVFIEAVNVDYDNLDLIPLSSFAQYILQFNQEYYINFYLYIASLVLASSQMVLRKIPGDILQNLARTMSSIPEDQIIMRNQYNMTKIELIQRNTSIILGQNQA